MFALCRIPGSWSHALVDFGVWPLSPGVMHLRFMVRLRVPVSVIVWMPWRPPAHLLSSCCHVGHPISHLAGMAVGALCPSCSLVHSSQHHVDQTQVESHPPRPQAEGLPLALGQGSSAAYTPCYDLGIPLCPCPLSLSPPDMGNHVQVPEPAIGPCHLWAFARVPAQTGRCSPPPRFPPC